MSSALEKYKNHLEKFDLTEHEKEDLIGSIECIVDSILDKKFMLGLEEYDDFQATR